MRLLTKLLVLCAAIIASDAYNQPPLLPPIVAAMAAASSASSSISSPDHNVSFTPTARPTHVTTPMTKSFTQIVSDYHKANLIAMTSKEQSNSREDTRNNGNSGGGGSNGGGNGGSKQSAKVLTSAAIESLRRLQPHALSGSATYHRYMMPNSAANAPSHDSMMTHRYTDTTRHGGNSNGKPSAANPSSAASSPSASSAPTGTSSTPSRTSEPSSGRRERPERPESRPVADKPKPHPFEIAFKSNNAPFPPPPPGVEHYGPDPEMDYLSSFEEEDTLHGFSDTVHPTFEPATNGIPYLPAVAAYDDYGDAELFPSPNYHSYTGDNGVESDMSSDPGIDAKFVDYGRLMYINQLTPNQGIGYGSHPAVTGHHYNPLEMASASKPTYAHPFAYEQKLPQVNIGYVSKPTRIFVSPMLYKRECKYDCFASPLKDMRYAIMNLLQGKHVHGRKK